jgi:hypothetical protein
MGKVFSAERMSLVAVNPMERGKGRDNLRYEPRAPLCKKDKELYVSFWCWRFASVRCKDLKNSSRAAFGSFVKELLNLVDIWQSGSRSHACLALTSLFPVVRI